MVSSVTVKIFEKEIKLIEGDEPTRREILRATYGIAKMAATQMGAPRRTGRGANSIRGKVSTEDKNAGDVSWSQKYYYMVFHHDGWAPRGQPRRPGIKFLERAFEQYRLD